MSKMQWQVSLDSARSSRRARSGALLVLVSLLGWLQIMAPAYAEAAARRRVSPSGTEGDRCRQGAGSTGSARQMKYPFKQEYPIPVIKNPSEMVARFDEVFDDAL